jgi:hypothetical protein
MKANEKRDGEKTPIEGFTPVPGNPVQPAVAFPLAGVATAPGHLNPDNLRPHNN